ncbi:hypothetical protein, partial [Oscillatoria sp. HE19RPO]|uniref:hypothetical protein n=1 Tax=Oscillatoria sp. HE19RPO TaxID=2954806 RepID=UPI0020C3A490
RNACALRRAQALRPYIDRVTTNERFGDFIFWSSLGSKMFVLVHTLRGKRSYAVGFTHSSQYLCDRSSSRTPP